MKAEKYLHIDPVIDQESLLSEIDRLKRFEDELQKRIDALEIRHRTAVEASRQKSRFIASLSHELRTPLTSIIGFSEILLEDTEDPLSLNQKNLLSKVNRNADRLLNMMNDLLDLSKLECGRQTVNLSPVDVRSLICQVIETMEPLVRDKDVTLSGECGGDVPIIRTDDQKLGQVLVNLVSNAIKFTPNGTVTLKVGLVDGNVVISVTDTGIGIRRTDFGRIFEEFHQIQCPGLRVDGAGLGLAITRQLVQIIGGEIEVSSKLGAGSTFAVTLPVTLSSSS